MTSRRVRKHGAEIYFNSHPHEEDDWSDWWDWRCTENFNSHPHEEDDLLCNSFPKELGYFNSHPHEEDDLCPLCSFFHSFDISTHILTKRMTKYLRKIRGLTRISTHILTKRMTPESALDAIEAGTFQLTSSRRGWQIAWISSSDSSSFQLTSSRRGWRYPSTQSESALYFNSHPHEEDDCHVVTVSSSFRAFQLTSSRRGWRYICNGKNTGRNHFNSHPHEEDDS